MALAPKFLPNPAANHSDPTVKEAFGLLFERQAAPKQYGKRHRAGEYTDPVSGEKVYLHQVFNGQTWQTVFAIDSSGNVYWKGGTATTGVDFTSKRWNPSDLG